MPLCLRNTNSGSCARQRGHGGTCNHLASWTELTVHLNKNKRVKDKILRSTKETAGKGGEWAFLQNKVSRACHVAIEYANYVSNPNLIRRNYDYSIRDGYVVYAQPQDYFSSAGVARNDWPRELNIGDNCIIFYRTDREMELFPPLGSWNILQLVDDNNNPVNQWSRATNRIGEYAVWIKRQRSYYTGDTLCTRGMLGIRQDEYCGELHLRHCVAQMAYLAWNTAGVMEEFRQTEIPNYLRSYMEHFQLEDDQRFIAAGSLSNDGQTQCPFCHNILSIEQLVGRARQQQGRILGSSNATALHLMHITPLRMNEFNHSPYNLSFGHAKCNHAQGEDSVTDSVRFLFKTRVQNALHGIGEVRETVLGQIFGFEADN